MTPELVKRSNMQKYQWHQEKANKISYKKLILKQPSYTSFGHMTSWCTLKTKHIDKSSILTAYPLVTQISAIC